MRIIYASIFALISVLVVKFWPNDGGHSVPPSTPGAQTRAGLPAPSLPARKPSPVISPQPTAELKHQDNEALHVGEHEDPDYLGYSSGATGETLHVGQDQDVDPNIMGYSDDDTGEVKHIGLGVDADPGLMGHTYEDAGEPIHLGQPVEADHMGYSGEAAGKTLHIDQNIDGTTEG